ncbi:MAG: tyrosine-protein phosphatase [Hyphomonadaceae bacterium]|nr:tyrosine-protein phosphatase [Hyphomonadaceae bacterium]
METAPNFRDVGGLTAKRGRELRRGQVYRSEAVLNPNKADETALRDAGVVLVCDLRSESERERAPNAWWRAQGTELLEFDVLADVRGSADAWATLAAAPALRDAMAVRHSLHGGLPEAAATHFSVIAHRIASGGVPLLIHCTAGKDRTGFLVAALLTLLDVREEALVADYLANAGRDSATVREATGAIIAHHIGQPIGDDALSGLVGVEESYLRASFPPK